MSTKESKYFLDEKMLSVSTSMEINSKALAIDEIVLRDARKRFRCYRGQLRQEFFPHRDQSV